METMTIHGSKNAVSAIHKLNPGNNWLLSSTLPYAHPAAALKSTNATSPQSIQIYSTRYNNVSSQAISCSITPQTYLLDILM